MAKKKKSRKKGSKQAWLEKQKKELKELYAQIGMPNVNLGGNSKKRTKKGGEDEGPQRKKRKRLPSPDKHNVSLVSPLMINKVIGNSTVKMPIPKDVVVITEEEAKSKRMVKDTPKTGKSRKVFVKASNPPKRQRNVDFSLKFPRHKLPMLKDETFQQNLKDYFSGFMQKLESAECFQPKQLQALMPSFKSWLVDETASKIDQISKDELKCPAEKPLAKETSSHLEQKFIPIFKKKFLDPQKAELDKVEEKMKNYTIPMPKVPEYENAKLSSQLKSFQERLKKKSEDLKNKLLQEDAEREKLFLSRGEYKEDHIDFFECNPDLTFTWIASHPREPVKPMQFQASDLKGPVDLSFFNDIIGKKTQYFDLI